MRSERNPSGLVQDTEKNAGPVDLASPIALLTVLSIIFFSLVWLYDTALRDPRYLDGPLLAIGLGAQVWLYFQRKLMRVTPKQSAALRRRHIITGWFLVAVFISHTRLSLPDSSLEWALWAEFIAISLSGILGTYLAWMVPSRLMPQDPTSVGNIPARVSELAKKAHYIVKKSQQAHAASLLPQAPHQIWITDLYDHRLRPFLAAPQPLLVHLTGSRKRMKKLVREIDALEAFMDEDGSNRLKMIREIVIEKDQLDYAYMNLEATRLWLFVHVPTAFALVLLATFHILVVCSFSAGT